MKNLCYEKKELGYIVDFLVDGEIQCEYLDDFLKIPTESICNKFEKPSQLHSKEHLVACIFSWLNLPENDRKESCLQIINKKSLNGIQKDANCNDVGSSTLPNLNKLVEKVWEELKVSNISLSDFAKKVRNVL